MHMHATCSAQGSSSCPAITMHAHQGASHRSNVAIPSDVVSSHCNSSTDKHMYVCWYPQIPSAWQQRTHVCVLCCLITCTDWDHVHTSASGNGCWSGKPEQPTTSEKLSQHTCSCHRAAPLWCHMLMSWGTELLKWQDSYETTCQHHEIKSLLWRQLKHTHTVSFVHN